MKNARSLGVLRLGLRLLSLDAGTANAAHDVLPEEDEEQQERGGDEDRRGHLDAVLGLAARVREGSAKRVRDEAPFLVVGGNEVRPDIGVPGAHELEDEDGDEGRGSEGDHDLPEVLPVGFAVDFRREIKLVRDLLEVLTEQINEERRGKKMQWK